MCPNGCIIDSETYACKVCKRPLKEIMDAYKVPEKDQEHTINWLIYHQYQ